MSTVALLINLAALGLYGYSAYYMNALSFNKGMQDIVPPQLHVYGQLKFLTYQGLLIQIVSTILHILAHFVKPLRGVRDVVFSTLAYPTGSIVVYTFWAVWLLFGREQILPERMDKFFPTWLNHSTHTIIVPINIILSVLLHHRYIKNGALVTLGYMALYTCLLFYIKAQTGMFVYGYLNQFNDLERTIYFASTGFFAYLVYKSGQLLTYAVHGSSEKHQVASGKISKKQKQK